MRKIGPKNSKQELHVQRIIESLKLKHTLHDPELPGRPDIVFKKLRKVIFINGCFWHGHKQCKRAKLPDTNKSFWSKKIFGNRKRDERIKKTLNNNGWHYRVIWQCQIKKSKDDVLRRRIVQFVMNGR